MTLYLKAKSLYPTLIKIQGYGF